jgi:hypothetical protein
MCLKIGVDCHHSWDDRTRGQQTLYVILVARELNNKLTEFGAKKFRE